MNPGAWGFPFVPVPPAGPPPNSLALAAANVQALNAKLQASSQTEWKSFRETF